MLIPPKIAALAAKSRNLSFYLSAEIIKYLFYRHKGKYCFIF